MKSKELISMENWTFRDSTFCREIRRVNRNRIILAALVFALIFYFDTFGTIYRIRMSNCDPEPVTHEELSAITNPVAQLTPLGISANHESSEEFNENVELKRLCLVKNDSCIMRLTPLGYTEVDINSGSNDYVEYVLGRLSTGKYLLVKRSGLVPLDTITGTVGYLPGDLRSVILQNSEIADADLCPLIFDATSETFSNLTTEIVFSVLLLAAWGLWLFFIIRRAMSVERDPAYKRLYTCHGTVEEIARQLDDELNDAGCYRSGRTIVTENWRIRKGLFTFLAEPRSSEE